jgi:hypothetical protein
MKRVQRVQRSGQRNAPDDVDVTSAGASALSSEQRPDPALNYDPVLLRNADRVSVGEPSAKRRNQDRYGKFIRGNIAALKHGRRSRAVANALLPEQREALAMLADHEAAILVDLGGDIELSTFEKDLVRKYQQLDAIAEFNAPKMLHPRASVRKESRDTFMNAIDRMLKIIGQLGLQRRSKQITETPSEWAARVVAARAAEAEHEHTDDEHTDGQIEPPTEDRQ